MNIDIKLHKDDLPEDLELGNIIAVDGEFMGLNVVRDPLCLIQISRGNSNAHIVQLDRSNYDAPNLKKVLSDEKITKIFHYGRADMAHIKYYLNTETKNILDTKIASKLARSYSDSHSLKTLIKEFINIDVIEANIFDEVKIRKLFTKTDICINLIGILYETGKGSTFKNIHSIFPSILAKLCKEYKVQQFIHLSALGINDAIDSEYAKSKLEGEINIQKIFPLTAILRPSVVYSVDDNFTTNFMTLLSRLPFFPLYYKGDTKFSPIHCSDLTDIIYHIIFKSISSSTFIQNTD